MSETSTIPLNNVTGAILSGLLVASDYTAGKELVQDRNFKDNQVTSNQIFVIECSQSRLFSGKLLKLEEDTR